MPVTDRIELTAKSQSLKILNICGAICLAAWLFMVFSSETVTAEDIRALILVGIFWSLLGKLWSQDAGIFIEWRVDQIEYKTHKEAGVIDVCSLNNIDVGLDEIRVYSENDHVQVINIERFSDYETRLRIKANFSQLQKELETA